MIRVASHPEPTVLAAFIDGNVDGKELHVLTEHLIDCEECRSVVRAGAAFQRQAATKVRASRQLRIGKWLIAAMLLIAFASALPLYRWYIDPLRSLQGESRRLEARLTAFEHAPFAPPRRSSTETTQALAHLYAEVRRDRTPANLHRLALGELALGRVRAGHDLLTEALEFEPRNGALWSDLAAAKISLGDIPNAAEASARALEYEPDLAAAAFNWALSLERLEVRSSATEAWTQYLRLEPTGSWADEAHARSKDIVPAPKWDASNLVRLDPADSRLRQIVSRHPQQARKTILGSVLPRWIIAADIRDLHLARAVGRIRAAAGDPFLLDVVEHTAANRENVRDGILAYASASDELTKRRTESAGAGFLLAGRQLRIAQSPLAWSADILTASCDFYGGRSEAALARLSKVRDEWQRAGRRYPGVAADAEWVRGLILSRLDANASLEAYRRGMAEARRGGDVEHEAALLALVVEILDRVEDTGESDRLRIQSLRQLHDTAATSDRMYNAFSSGAYAMLRSGRPRVAGAFIDAQERIARTTGDPLQLAESATERALALRDLGRHEAAERHLQLARTPASRIPTEALRERTLSNLALVAGTIYARSDPARAVAEITSAIATWERYGWRVHTATAYLLRGEVLARTNPRAAESDFRAGIAEMERQRDRIAEPRLRVTYFERADHLFSRLIELMLDQDRTGEALAVAERKRSHEILRTIAAGAPARSTAPLDSNQLASAIADDTVLVEYILLERGAAIWAVGRRGTFFARSPSRGDAIQGMITRHLAAIAVNDLVAASLEARALYRQLIAPVGARLSDVTRVVIVADDRLQLIPFAALLDPDGRYLIESFTIALAPSGSTFVHSGRGAERRGSLLAVAQPAPAGADMLPNAERETRDVADFYRDSSVYVGREIAPDEFLRRAGEMTIVHFAGHARLDPYEPRGSALLFEGDAEPAAMLRAEKISAARLTNRPLVILAGCSTGNGPLRRNEGLDSLATAFLRAGAHGVVATLWDVEDDTAALLFREFHKQLSNDRDAAEALRDAQIALLRSTNDRRRQPKAWAGYALFGN